MQPQDSPSESTFRPTSPLSRAGSLLSDTEVERLGALNAEYDKDIRTARTEQEKEGVREQIRRQVEARLRSEGHPWPDVWAHAVANDHIQHDAKYRVMLDWFNNWVQRLDQAKAFGRFEQVKRLGAGGFGAVFKAYDPRRTDWVAIKVPYVATMPGDRHTVVSSAQQRLTFFEEACRHAKIRVKGCVPLFDLGMPSGFAIDDVLAHLRNQPVWFSMQYIDGRSLLELLHPTTGEYRPGCTMSDNQVVDLMTRVAQILKCLHATAGPNSNGSIIHKDLKPANIIVDQHGEPWLTDFGLAVPRFDQLVFGNVLSGTPAYMAPEQWDLQGVNYVNAQTDIWAWGVIFFELLVGRPPFLGTSADLREQVLHGDADSLRAHRTDAPVYLDKIIQICLKRQRDARFGSFAEVLESLQAPRVTPDVAEQIRSGLERVESDVALVRDALIAGQRAADGASRLPDGLACDEFLDKVEGAKGIVGRETFVADLFRDLTGTSRYSSREGRTLLVHGKPGIGKTGVMQKFLDAHPMSCRHFIKRNTDYARPEVCLENLCKQIVTRYPRYRESLRPSQNLFEWRHTFGNLLKQVSTALVHGHRLVIVIDGLDELQRPAGGEILNPLNLPDPPLPGIYIVVSSRASSLPLSRYDPYPELGPNTPGHKEAVREYILNHFRPAADGPSIRAPERAEREQAARQMTARVERAGLTVEAFLQQVESKSGWNFMYAYYVMLELRRGNSHINLVNLPPGLVPYYQDHWRRMWELQARDPRILKALFALCKGTRICSALWLRKYAGVGADEVLLLLESWAMFLESFEHRDRTQCYTFYHDSYLEFLKSDGSVRLTYDAFGIPVSQLDGEYLDEVLRLM